MPDGLAMTIDDTSKVMEAEADVADDLSSVVLCVEKGEFLFLETCLDQGDGVLGPDFAGGLSSVPLDQLSDPFRHQKFSCGQEFGEIEVASEDADTVFGADAGEGAEAEFFDGALDGESGDPTFVSGLLCVA